MTDEGFVSDILNEQKTTRSDIRALKETIELQSAKIDCVLESLRQIEEFQGAIDKRESRQLKIIENVARIADSAVLLAEDTHRQASILTGILEKLDKRLSEDTMSRAADSSLGKLILQIDGLAAVLDDKSSK